MPICLNSPFQTPSTPFIHTRARKIIHIIHRIIHQARDSYPFGCGQGRGEGHGKGCRPSLGRGIDAAAFPDHEVGAPCRTRGTVLQAWGSFFMCRFFSLDKEKKRRKKRNSTGIMAIADEPLRLVEVLFGPFSFKKKERRLSIKTYLNRLSSPAPPSTACPPPGR